MGNEKAVEGGFVFIHKVNEHPGGSGQAVPHCAVQSSQIEKLVWRTMKYLNIWFNIELGYRNTTNEATIWCVHTNFRCSSPLLR